jgi:hypothetical protein
MARVSKPGRRVYRGAADIKPVLNGLGVAIVSTSRGLLTDRQAREQRLGGEVLTGHRSTTIRPIPAAPTHRRRGSNRGTLSPK